MTTPADNEPDRTRLPAPSEMHMTMPDEQTDPLSEQLTDLGAAIRVGDATTSLSAVCDTAASRRRRRNIIGGSLAAAVLVAGGVVVLGAVSDGDGPDTIAIDGAGDDTANDTSADLGPAEAGSGAPAGEDGAVDTVDAPRAVPVETRQVAAISPVPTRVSVGNGASGEQVEQFAQVVAWQGGFLAASTTYAPQLLPDELPAEIQELFSPEVIEFFDGELPPTIDEAAEMLAEAGLLDEVTAVLQSNPEAFEAIYGANNVPDADTEVVFSADGISWEPIEFVLPPGASAIYGMQSTGTRLAVAIQEEPEFSSQTQRPDQTAPIHVVTTTDLVNWDVVELDVGGRPADLPEVVQFGFSPSNLVINDSGWMLRVDSYADIDIEALLPDEVLEASRTGGGGYGTSWDDTGVLIEVFGNGGPVETVPSQRDGDGEGDVELREPEVSEQFSFTWDELGVAPEMVEQVAGGPARSELFTAAWGSAPVEVDGIEAWTIAASSDGFYVSQGGSINFSVDGTTWSEIALPGDSAYVSSIKTLPEGIVALIGTDNGSSTLFRLADAAGSWERLEIPGAPTSMSDIFGGMGGTPAMIIDGTEREAPEPTEVTVETDGFTMVLREGGGGSSILVKDSDGTVVAEESFDWRDGGEPTLWRYSNSGIDILTEAGDTIVTFGNDIMETAYREQTDRFDEMNEFEPDLWLLATIDGERWLVEDIDASIDDGMVDPSGIAISGDILLLNSGNGWDRYDLS